MSSEGLSENCSSNSMNDCLVYTLHMFTFWACTLAALNCLNKLTNLTHRTTPFPSWLSRTPWNLGQSGKSCVKLAHAANQGKVWQTRPVKEIELLNLLYLAPLQTFPHFTHFTPVCHMSLCQSVFFGFSTLHRMSNLWKCSLMHGTLEMCVKCCKWHILSSRIHRKFAALHVPPQFSTVWHGISRVVLELLSHNFL